MIHIPGNVRDSKDRKDQDGRRGGCGAHPPTQTHPKHTYIWNNSQGKPGRTPIQPKLQERVPHNWIGWRKVMGLGGLWKEGKVPYRSPSPWGASRLSWASRPWRPPWRRPVPLTAGRPAGTGRRAGEPGPHLWIVHGAGLPSTGQRELLTDRAPHCAPQPECSKHPGPACLLHTGAWPEI